MYESFYGLKDKPFSLLPDPAFLYLSKQHDLAITLLEYSLENQAGFCVISGKAGTGKTTLLRRLLNQIGDDVSVGLITNTHHSFGELLRWILHAFDLDDSGSNRARQHQVFINSLNGQYAKKRRTMLIIDEAQNMSSEALEELRMLSNINSEKDMLLQMILVGQPPLRDVLRRPELEQFAQRVTVDFHLESLGGEETRRYIRHRLQVSGGKNELFTDEACKAVYLHSGGVPRLINLLCDLALVYGYAAQATAITGGIIEQVVREREIHGALPVFNAPPESLSMPHMSMKDAHAVLASNPPESVASRYARQAASPRLVGEVGHVSAAAEELSLSTTRMDISTKGRVHAVRGASTGETPQIQVTPQSTAAVHDTTTLSIPSMKFGGETGQKDLHVSVTVAHAENNPVSVLPAEAISIAPTGASPDVARMSNNPGIAAESALVPSEMQDVSKPADARLKKQFWKLAWKIPRLANAERPARLRRYVPAIAMISVVAVAWIVLERQGLTSVFNNYLSQAPETVMAQVFEPKSVNTAPASGSYSAVQPAPGNSATQQVPAESPVAATNTIAEEARLKQIERERDAILAIAEAARIEREALRKAALAREQALVAEHERALARERSLAKEHEMALLRERVRADQRAQAMELARQEAHEAEIAAEAKSRALVPPYTPMAKADNVRATSTKVDGASPRNPVTELTDDAAVSETSAFTANPCKGPSARFLSTCE